ncbi:response regulator [Pedobacter jamesrossensis]|uniref:Response regulator n=1 Tax=Pedobacter jamesrossensis TaxID=1908238 RepID=A0ABV8NQT5_9SPHI
MKIKLLNIDDDELVLFIHETLIQQTEFYEDSMFFLNAKNGLEFLDNSKVSDAEYLLLLDINMPGMNGWDLLDVLKHRSYASKIKVILLSSSENESDRLKAKNYELVQGFLSKPLKIEHFDTIKQIAGI